jgi:hypothetical protein
MEELKINQTAPVLKVEKTSKETGSSGSIVLTPMSEKGNSKFPFHRESGQIQMQRSGGKWCY